jgi:hydrogenase nickel incorporation protein HypA/HybF
MHEFSLMSGLLSQIEKVATDNQADKVTKIKVRIGAMAHISSDHFREHFEHGVKGTIAEGAELEVEMNEDKNDPNAADILLESIDVQ